MIFSPLAPKLFLLSRRKQMYKKSLSIKDFLSQKAPLIDVRSPKEFEQGHIPSAKNLALLNNEERIIVGTLYKQEGEKAALHKGLEIFAPKIEPFLEEALKISSQGAIGIYCWRGGMRSQFVTWLLKLLGNKSFRHYALKEIAKERQLICLGGYTGSGKTEILQTLSKKRQVLDLESLANHKGSSFGQIDMPSQPSNEQFENKIAWELLKQDSQKPCWIESESRMIGSCKIPDSLFEAIFKAALIEISLPIEERKARLLRDYGQKDPQVIKAASQKLEKRLGKERYQQLLHDFEEGKLEKALDTLLAYYDRTYEHALKKRNKKADFSLSHSKLSSKDWSTLLDLLAEKELYKTVNKQES